MEIWWLATCGHGLQCCSLNIIRIVALMDISQSKKSQVTACRAVSGSSVPLIIRMCQHPLCLWSVMRSYARLLWISWLGDGARMVHSRKLWVCVLSCEAEAVASSKREWVCWRLRVSACCLRVHGVLFKRQSVGCYQSAVHTPLLGFSCVVDCRYCKGSWVVTGLLWAMLFKCIYVSRAYFLCLLKTYVVTQS